MLSLSLHVPTMCHYWSIDSIAHLHTCMQIRLLISFVPSRQLDLINNEIKTNKNMYNLTKHCMDYLIWLYLTCSMHVSKPTTTMQRDSCSCIVACMTQTNRSLRVSEPWIPDWKRKLIHVISMLVWSYF